MNRCDQVASRRTGSNTGYVKTKVLRRLPRYDNAEPTGKDIDVDRELAGRITIELVGHRFIRLDMQFGTLSDFTIGETRVSARQDMAQIFYT